MYPVSVCGYRLYPCVSRDLTRCHALAGAVHTRGGGGGAAAALCIRGKQGDGEGGGDEEGDGGGEGGGHQRALLYTELDRLWGMRLHATLTAHHPPQSSSHRARVSGRASVRSNICRNPGTLCLGACVLPRLAPSLSAALAHLASNLLAPPSPIPPPLPGTLSRLAPSVVATLDHLEFGFLLCPVSIKISTS